MEPNAPNGRNGRDDHDDQNGHDDHNGHDNHGLGVLRQARVWIAVLAIVALLAIFARSKLAFVLGVVIFVVALLASVMLHELGHFLTAKKFGMRVTQFFLGFGNTLWSTFRGETEYGVKALPFGGFVKITGMTSVEEVDVADEPRSFRNQPGWQRIIVLAAGSFMHFALAFFLLFVLAIGIGQSADTNVINSIASCVPASNYSLNHSANPCAGGHLAKSPAAAAGLKPDDKIVSVAGKPVGSWNRLKTVLATQKAGGSVPGVVDRDGRQLDFTATLAAIPGRATAYLGIEPTVEYQRSNFFGAVSFAGDQFANTLTSSASAIGKLPSAIPDLFSKNRAHTAGGQVSSVVGVGEVTGDVVQAALPWQAKVSVLLVLIASLNIFVGA